MTKVYLEVIVDRILKLEDKQQTQEDKLGYLVSLIPNVGKEKSIDILPDINEYLENKKWIREYLKNYIFDKDLDKTKSIKDGY